MVFRNLIAGFQRLNLHLLGKRRIIVGFADGDISSDDKIIVRTGFQSVQRNGCRLCLRRGDVLFLGGIIAVHNISGDLVL